MAATKDSFFSPTKLSAQQKAASTHEAAMQIIDAEVAAREKKTKRLRELRKIQEDAQPEVAAPKVRRTRAKQG